MGGSSITHDYIYILDGRLWRLAGIDERARERQMAVV